MSVEALNVISRSMKSLKLNYAFMEWKGLPCYPYWIGEYQEVESSSEDGLQETTFILTGFTRGSWLDLEAQKEIIENYFNKYGHSTITDSGSAVVVMYQNSLVIPTGDLELKKIQINMTIKEWKVK